MSSKNDKIQLKGVEVPDWYIELEPQIIELVNQKDQIESKLTGLRKTVADKMKAEGVDTILSDLTMSSLTKDTIVHKFDAKEFRKCHSDLYEEYCKKYPRSGSVSFQLVYRKKKKAK